jgi:two-component system, OmpR family, phosphate regulon response regulator PhoB
VSGDHAGATSQTGRAADEPYDPEVGRPHILIVEDEPGIAMLLEDVLDDHGYLTSHVYDGASAVNLLHAEGLRPDLIMMDLNLPRLSGEAAIAAIKDHPETRAIPIIAMSARADRILAVFQGGRADRALGKPFNIDELLAGIAIELARAHKAAPESVGEDVLLDVRVASPGRPARARRPRQNGGRS